MYEKRIVLFLDMMGFKQMLGKPEDLVIAITELKNVLRPSEKEKLYADFDFIQFSDSIVIAAKTSYLANAVTFVLRLMLKVNILVTSHGIPVRGAIVCGDYYYKDDILLSPALADAYKLESTFARYPRVIISKSFTDYLSTLTIKQKSYSTFREDYDFITMVDNDGFRFLNYLSSSGTIAKDMEYKDMDLGLRASQLDAHRKFIEKNLNSEVNEAVREKYIWMGNYHNRFLREEAFLKNANELLINSKALILNH